MTFRACAAATIGFVAALCFVAGLSPAADPETPAGVSQPAPKLATLQGQHLPLAKALEELARQTSESAADQLGEPDAVLDLDLKNATFWEALDALADKAGARVDLHDRDGGIALARRPAGWQPPPVSHSGLFRTTLRALGAKLDLETDTRTCTAALEVAWEPHLLPLLLETRPHSLVVRDDDGRPLPTGTPTSSLAPVDGRTSLAFDVALPAVPRAAGKLSLLEGELYAVAPTKMLMFAFASLDQLDKAPPADPRRRQTQEGVECRVSKVVAAADFWSVEITLDYPEGNVKLDSYQSWVVNNELYLERKDGGDRFPTSSYLLESATPRHAALTYNFTDRERLKRGLAEWNVVYRTPALVVKVPIAFSFKDVPLP